MKRVSKTKVAKTYAQALFEVAVENDRVFKIWGEVRAFREIVRHDKTFVKSFSNPLWLMSEKQKTLEEISVKMGWTEEFFRFLCVVVENDRAAFLRAILKEFAKICLVNKGYAEVDVYTVKDLSAEQNKRLVENLETTLNKKVLVNYYIEPEILGGLVIKYGSEMIDNSLKGKLNKLEIAMKG